MKSIELTEEHKSKLLEMCKVLFPEYGLPEGGMSFHHHDNGMPDKLSARYPNYLPGFIFGFKSNGEDGDKYDDASFFMHWFEFCMTHLIVRLSKEFTKQKLSKSDYTNNQYPNWFSEKLTYHLNPFKNEEFEEEVLFIHPIDYLYEEFKKLK